MDKERLIRRKEKAMNENDMRLLAEACYDLALYYKKNKLFSEALHQWVLAAQCYKKLGLKLELGRCNSNIGDMHITFSDHELALVYKKQHLDIAVALENREEQQEAWRSIGVVYLSLYLLQEQSSSDNQNPESYLELSQESFIKSLSLCNEFKTEFKKQEQVWLLLDLAVVQGHLQSFDIAFQFIEEALLLTTDNTIRHLCYMTKAQVCRQKKDNEGALNCLLKALDVAENLDRDISLLKKLDTLLTRSEVYCNMSNYENAKRDLQSAYMLEYNNDDKKRKIKEDLTVVTAICESIDSLKITAPDDDIALKKLNGRLGDGNRKLKNYAQASEHYLMMLGHAKKAGESGKTLAPIYVSLFQTYKDMKCYDNALVYYQKEYDLIKNDPKKALRALIGIAEVLALAKKPYEQVEKAYKEARDAVSITAICESIDSLKITAPDDDIALKKLNGRLGDGNRKLKNYAQASEHYLMMLGHAKKAGESGKTLAPIYVSLFQTYKDMKCYDNALVYYQKEYDLIKNDPKKALRALIGIAEVLALAKKPYEQVEKAYKEARDAARATKGTKDEIRVLRNLLKYQRKHNEIDKMLTTKRDLKALGCEDCDEVVNQEEDTPAEENSTTRNIGDDSTICHKEEEAEDNKNKGRRVVVRKNCKGENKLHQACITGNTSRVGELILLGYPLDEGDNAGWRPLHEACIYGHLEIVQLLIGHGASVNVTEGENGTTPMHDAATNGHLEVVQLLLDSGGKPSLKNSLGETPLDVLKMWRDNIDLTEQSASLYDALCKRMSDFIEADKSTNPNVSEADKNVILETNDGEAPCASNSKTPEKPIQQENPQSHTKITRRNCTPIKQVEAKTRRSSYETIGARKELKSQAKLRYSQANNDTVAKKSKLEVGVSVSIQSDTNDALSKKSAGLQDEMTRKNAEPSMKLVQQAAEDTIDDLKNQHSQTSINKVNNVKLAEKVSVNVQTDNNVVLAKELSLDDLRVIILEKLNPKMSADEANALFKILEEKLDNLHERHWQEIPAEPMPCCTLLPTKASSGLRFQCHDTRSLKWLKSTVTGINGLWEGNRGFVVLQDSLIKSYQRAEVRVPDVNTEDAGKIKHYLATQNLKHDIASWPLLDYIVDKENGKYMVLTFGIPPVEIEKLQLTDFHITYRLGTLHVKLIKGTDENIRENLTIEGMK